MTSSVGKLRILLSFGDIAEFIALGKSLITEDLRSMKWSNKLCLSNFHLLEQIAAASLLIDYVVQSVWYT
ncbi:hypothetical protein [Mycobacterium leprae]|uniref:hypothetical protein n=1 Tax=Mycobacterium leprae TaxID=1769 RepID=UPI000ABFF62B